MNESDFKEQLQNFHDLHPGQGWPVDNRHMVIAAFDIASKAKPKEFAPIPIYGDHPLHIHDLESICMAFETASDVVGWEHK